jgi:hypothetical protein
VPAQAILACATQPIRDLMIGGAAKMTTALGAVAPRLVDYYMEDHLFEDQQTDERVRPDRHDNLYDAIEDDGGERGRYDGHVMNSSIYTSAVLHPAVAAGAIGALGAALFGVTRYIARHDQHA